MIEKRKKDLKRLAALVALTLAGFLLSTILLTWACQLVLLKSDFRLSRASRPGTHVKLLVVGNSRGVNLFDAAQSSPPAFNLSYNGLTGDAIFALTRDFFRSGNSADAILLEVSGLLGGGANCELKPFWGLLPELTNVSTP